MNHKSPLLALWRVLLVALLTLGALGFPLQKAQAAVGWVGNMLPAGGSSSTILPGDTFDVSIQVYKASVTDSPGQGAGISCTLHWGKVASFGGGWSNVTDTPMTYNNDVGNNDEYKTTITPGAGLYEFTAFCSDGSVNTWQSAGNGKLTVQTTQPGSCTGASSDNNVYYAGLFHDSFSTTYRFPLGAVPWTQGAVTLTLRTCAGDLSASPEIRVWNARAGAQTINTMTLDSTSTDPTLGSVSYWKYDLAIPSTSTILYYAFRLTDGTTTAFYGDDDPAFFGGGYGQAYPSNIFDTKSYQLTVYDPSFNVPEWLQRGVIYQIFPDRFRDGDPANDPQTGRFFYNESGGAIVRSNASAWNTAICDPRAGGPCSGKYSDNFYGGDLQGIIDKINQGYFDNLGITVLYLNPIFRSPSNHKYDTADYLTIDPDFGTLADFQELADAADAHGMTIILDGVFNHVSSDSTYFDRYHRYDAVGNLTSPGGIGTDDNSGACESPTSAFRGWFYLPDTLGSPALDEGGVTAFCTTTDGSPDVLSTSYSAWWGYSSLPKLQATIAAIKNLIWNNGTASVGPYWVDQGASGWRLDVGGDVDPGIGTPGNTYWEGFRAAVRAINPQTAVIGEEWGDATPWLLGSEWDSVMNYRYRSAMLSWLFTGCSGSGCSGGTKFQENDSNDSSSSGSIAYLSPSQFNARLRAIQEDYPPMVWKGMMNLAGSHDTNRILFLLKKVNNDNPSAAIQRLKELWLFAFSYAGAPTIYYGDEVGLTQDGVFANSAYQDDPYNRVPFPWDDTPGANSANTDLQSFARSMSSTRLSYRALQDGEVQHGILIDDTNKLYGFARTYGSGDAAQTALIILNRSDAAHQVTLNGLNAAPYSLLDGQIMVDPANNRTETMVSAGSLTVTVNSNWGVILLEKNQLDKPTIPGGLSLLSIGSGVSLKWSPVTRDISGGYELATQYTLHRSATIPFTPSESNRIATIAPPVYGSSDGKLSYTDSTGSSSDYYALCAVNAPGENNCTGNQTVSPLLNLSKNGGGTVSSSPAGIACGATCTLQTANFFHDEIVTLSAVPSSGYQFDAWGGDCSGSGSCVLSMSADHNISASFSPLPIQYTLELTKTGGGEVNSNPAGIACGETCTGQSANFNSGTLVTLTAAPGNFSSFLAWGGDCSGSTLTCQVTMNAAHTVTAVFITYHVMLPTILR